MRGAATAIRTAKPGNRHMDFGQLQGEINQIAFAAIWKREYMLYRARDGQMIHMPVQALFGA